MRTVLINAGPWLPVPPPGYGGIENVIATLVPELRARGVRVVLATVGSSTLPADEYVTVFPDGQFAHLQRPYNQVSGVAHAHMQAVVRRLRAADRAGPVDLVHDHTEVVGLSVLAAMGPAAPPVLHTLHWALHKHPELYAAFDGGGRVFVNGVSASQVASAPPGLRAHAIGHVHLATPLATRDVPRVTRGDHFVVLGRITPVKGQHLAARLAHDLGVPLVLAGPVGPYQHPSELDGADGNPDVRYWCDEVAPLVDGKLVRWVGTLGGADRDALVASARASLFPVQWEEPGGTAVVESLALGTPVVGLARGCLPELVEHGRTGLLGQSYEELVELAGAADSIDPGQCRAEAVRRLTPARMAEDYLRLYRRVAAAAGPAPAVPTARAGTADPAPASPARPTG